MGNQRIWLREVTNPDLILEGLFILTTLVLKDAVLILISFIVIWCVCVSVQTERRTADRQTEPSLSSQRECA